MHDFRNKINCTTMTLLSAKQQSVRRGVNLFRAGITSTPLTLFHLSTPCFCISGTYGTHHCHLPLHVTELTIYIWTLSTLLPLSAAKSHLPMAQSVPTIFSPLSTECGWGGGVRSVVKGEGIRKGYIVFQAFKRTTI